MNRVGWQYSISISSFLYFIPLKSKWLGLYFVRSESGNLINLKFCCWLMGKGLTKHQSDQRSLLVTGCRTVPGTGTGVDTILYTVYRLDSGSPAGLALYAVVLYDVTLYHLDYSTVLYDYSVVHCTLLYTYSTVLKCVTKEFV